LIAGQVAAPVELGGGVVSERSYSVHIATMNEPLGAAELRLKPGAPEVVTIFQVQA
jgi:hypothetical protein